MTGNSENAPRKLLRLPQVKDLTGLSRATIYRYVDAGEFPRPVKLGPRAIAWHASDIDGWIAGRIPASTEADAA